MKNVARHLNSYARILAALTALTTLGNSGCSASGGITKADKSRAAEVEVVDLGSPQSSYSINEGSSQGVLLVLGKARSSDLVVSVSFKKSNGESASSDFSALPTSFTIAKGEQSASFSLQSLDDSIYEGTESFILTLNSNDKKVKLKDFAVTIVVNDNESVPVAQISANTQSVSESVGTGSIAVQLTPAAATTTVLSYTVTPGTASSGTDFTLASGSLTIAAGSTSGSIGFTVNDDVSAETTENFSVQIASVSSGTASIGAIDTQTVSITDNDTVSVSIADVSVSEAAGTVTATITQSGVSISATTVDFAVVAGSAPSATAGSDFTAATGTATIAAGQTTASVVVTIINDSLNELDETIDINLSNVSQGTISDNKGIITITDNDTAPSITISDVAQVEGNGGGTANFDFTVTLSAVSGRDVTMSYATSNGTATTANSDYNSTTGTLTIAAGQTTVTLGVPVVRDTTFEADENFSLVLSSASGATFVDHTGVGQITNDDTAPTVAFSAASQSFSEGSGTASVVVNLSFSSSIDTSIPFALTGTATGSGTDYTTPTSPVLITAGQTVATISIPIIDDSAGEGDETIILTIGTPTGATASGTTVHTLTVSDNDVYVNFASSAQNFNESSGRQNSQAWSPTYSAWTKRAKLQFGNGSRASNLTNFPVLVKLNSSRITYADFKAAGADIRFTDSDGTALSYEIESWNPSGDSYVWVKVPQIDASSNTDYITMYYGNSSASDAQSASSVWNSNYVGVWHLSGGATDSTSNAINGTEYSVSANAAGAVGPARTFNGTSSYIDLGNPASVPNGSNALSICAWMNPTTLNYTDAKMAVFIGTASLNQYIQMGYHSNYTLFGSGGNWSNTELRPLLSIKVNDWAHVCLTRDGSSNYVLYKNGASISTMTQTGGNLVRSLFRIGRDSGTGYFTGSIDEVRLMNTNLSASWMSADYASQVDQLISYQTPESNSSGRVTATVNLTAASASNVLVPYTVTGSADGSDHALSAGTLTIAAGNTSGDIQFGVNRDFTTEGDESVIITLGTPTNADAGSTLVHTVTLIDGGGSNSNPVANSDAFTFDPETVSAYYNVSANDTDADSDSLLVSSVSGGTHVTATILGRGILFSRAPGFTGIETFNYSIGDGQGGTASSTITVTVRSASQWTGATSGIWNVNGNWYNNSVPGHIAYISDSFCSTNCNITIDNDMYLNGLVISPNYTNTITQNPSRTITASLFGIHQYGGTFNGGDSAINTSAGGLYVHAGTFKSTSGTLSIGGRVLQLQSGVTFNHNSGTVASSHSNGTFTLNAYSNQPFYNVTISGSAGGTLFVNDPTIEGTLSITNGASFTECYGGTVYVKGHLTLDAKAGTAYYNCAGTFRISGSGNQTITSTAGNSSFPSLEIASTGGTVTFSGDVNVLKHFTYVSGNVTAPTNFTFGDDWNLSETITPGSIAFNNVMFDWGWTKDAKTLSGTMLINGDLTLKTASGWSPNINTGTLDLKGNLILDTYGAAGTATLQMTGTGTQTINQNSVNATVPNTLIINKASGQVELTSNVTFNRTGQSTQITNSGSVFMKSYTWALKALTLTSGTIHRGDGVTPAGAGTFTVNGAGVSDGAYGGGTIVNP